MHRRSKSIGWMNQAKKFLCTSRQSADSDMSDPQIMHREVNLKDDRNRNDTSIQVSAERGGQDTKTVRREALDKDISIGETPDSRSDQDEIGAAQGLHVTNKALLNEPPQGRGPYGRTTVSEHSNTASTLPSEPDGNDLRYRMRPSQYQLVDSESTSTGQLVATVAASSSQIEPNEGIVGPHTTDAMAEEDKADGTFRYILIRYDGDPNGDRARTQCIMHDTGSGCSLTFASKLVALGIDWEPVDFPPRCLESIYGEPFSPIGRRRIKFSYRNRTETTHWTNILVLADPPEGQQPQFDFLFGRDTIQKTKAINWDRRVIGHVRIQPTALKMLADDFPSLLAHSPPLSTNSQNQIPGNESRKLQCGISG